MIYDRYINTNCVECQTETKLKLTIYFIGRGKISIQAMCQKGNHRFDDPSLLVPSCLDLSHLTFERFLYDHSFYRDATDQYYADNPWIKKYMDAMGWWWICVCGGDVVAGSSNRLEFPTQQEKEALAKEHQAIPFCYAQPIVSESVFLES